MKRKAAKLLLMLITLIVLFAFPVTAKAATGGYFQLNKDGTRVEYRLKNGKKAGNTTVKKDKKKYTIVKGYVKLIDGKTYGKASDDMQIWSLFTM